MTKKKSTKRPAREIAKKKLIVSTEKVRPLGEDKLGDVAGASPCQGTFSGFYVCKADC